MRAALIRLAVSLVFGLIVALAFITSLWVVQEPITPDLVQTGKQLGAFGAIIMFGTLIFILVRPNPNKPCHERNNHADS